MASIIPNPEAFGDQAVKVETSGDTTYVGFAKIGAATSAASWQIFKIVSSGGVTTMTWADGDRKFNNIWDNRSSITYS